ncbi:hypothetical protein SAMN05444972_103133 [Marininema halotolerans]|uniref:Uncharacterized protein n=2 Tax=Marininema halotolerans TaxID=1155944 RepID=A0A1I6QG45_9BACL|nr:hypothetical protein SAMN05444972_103133 [Marininema halotolerans]
MKKWGFIALLSIMGVIGMLGGRVHAEAAVDEIPPVDYPSTIEFEDTFNLGTQGWSGEFADLPHTVENPDLYQTKFSLENMPAELDPSQQGLSLTGMNRSDDLFMYVKKQIKVKPNTRYYIDFNFDIATNAAPGKMGIGGAPGESVYVKAGAVAYEPKPIIDGDYYRFNVDKGNQKIEGSHAIVMGNLAKIGDQKSTYQLKNYTNNGQPFFAQSDADGDLWLFVGTDSGFEGLTKIYFSRISVTLNEVASIVEPPIIGK